MSDGNMFFDNGLMENYDCRHVVVVRWNQSDTTAAVPSANAVVVFIESVGYLIGSRERIGFSPSSKDPEQFIILPMSSVEEAKRICNDSTQRGFAINNTKVIVSPLLGLNGFRIRDAKDFMRISQEHFSNDELLDLLIISIRLELPERVEAIENGLRFIKQGITELVENAQIEMFGSFPSKFRRNGYSDVDINIKSIQKPTQKATNVRPLSELKNNTTCLLNKPLTEAELAAYPQEEVIKILFRYFNENPAFKNIFEMRFVPARTPIIIFKSKEVNDLKISFDVSVCNQISVDKANLLDEFIMKDISKENKMRNVMLFIVHWAKSNKLLPGAYPDEKLETKTNFNSYIFNHLIIHFVQAVTGRCLVHPHAKTGLRVDEYDFDSLFADRCKFLREFFKYYASFDFANEAIYGKQALQKKTLHNVHRLKETPLMMVDPMDCTHNISAKVTEDAMKLLNGLIRNALFILKQKQFHINQLLETNEIANALMKNREAKINVTTKVFGGAEYHYMSVQLPEVVTNSDDLLLLFTRVLRFDVSLNQEGPSVTDLYKTGGVTFTVQARSWVGRRNKKRLLKKSRHDLTPLQVEVMCSDTYQYEDEPIAELRIAMADVPTTSYKFAHIEMIRGQVSDIRDAMHYLIDQFVSNNYDELLKNGIQSINQIPSASQF